MFLQGLQELGWTDGHNVQIDYRWAGTNRSIRKYAAELPALAPDLILATATQATSALQQVTRTVPIVFVNVSIRSAPGWSRASRGRAGMSPGLPRSNMASAPNGWNYSKRSRPA